MVILKNIKRTGSDISADYYPEGKEPKGFMRMRLDDNEVIEHENASSFAEKQYYGIDNSSQR